MKKSENKKEERQFKAGDIVKWLGAEEEIHEIEDAQPHIKLRDSSDESFFVIPENCVLVCPVEERRDMKGGEA